MAPVPLVFQDQPLQISGGPLYYSTAQHDTVAAFQVTWYPKLHSMAPGTGPLAGSWFGRKK
jgi:hypothetical protein